MKQFFRITAALLAAAFLLALTGCGSSSSAPSFTWFVDTIPANLDPQVASAAPDVIACENLYSGLVRNKADGEIVPDLSESWTVSSDGKTYTFQIKDGLTYKAVNTMDSMLGYKNEKYLYFGRIPAKLDDAANYLPSRLAALLWVAAAAFTHNDAKGAWKIWRRDRRNHASPNSAQTESACAGALGVQLAGPAYYFGEYYDKPTIGDALRPVEPKDILRADRMMYAESLLALALGIALRLLVLAM